MNRIIVFCFLLSSSISFAHTGMISTITRHEVKGDSLYFKDGTAIGGKEELVHECMNGMNKKRKKNNDIAFNDYDACSCLMDVIAKNYTYDEFVSGGNKKNSDLFTSAEVNNPEAYKEMLSCMLSSMDVGGKQKEGKKLLTNNEKTEKEDNASNDKSIEMYFIKACFEEASKTKEYKQMNINIQHYCECTWAKIKEKNIPMNRLEELTDPNSPLFNEIITPCIMTSINQERQEAQVVEIPEIKSEDVVAAVKSDTLPLIKLMNIYRLKVNFKGIEKYFTLDSGANDVFINGDLERELLLDGKISKTDYLPAQTYHLADGTIITCRRAKLSGITIGEFTVNNVVIAISDKPTALLLLGKSFFDKFSEWKIDNQQRLLILNR